MDIIKGSVAVRNLGGKSMEDDDNARKMYGQYSKISS